MRQVLLVDDNATQLIIRELVLRKAGIESHAATSANAALALLRSSVGQENIGAVITDHLMPGMDGSQFVRELRKFAPAMPVIVISGLSEAEDDYRGLEVVFRTKPLDPEELIALIRATLSASGNRATA
jgi:DNA-binding response OmpR family regulator